MNVVDYQPRGLQPARFPLGSCYITIVMHADSCVAHQNRVSRTNALTPDTNIAQPASMQPPSWPVVAVFAFPEFPKSGLIDVTRPFAIILAIEAPRDLISSAGSTVVVPPHSDVWTGGTIRGHPSGSAAPRLPAWGPGCRMATLPRCCNDCAHLAHTRSNEPKEPNIAKPSTGREGRVS